MEREQAVPSFTIFSGKETNPSRLPQKCEKKK